LKIVFEYWSLGGVMTCSITISNIIGINPSSTGNSFDSLKVEGTATNCTNVVVSIYNGFGSSAPVATVVVSVTGGDFVATLDDPSGADWECDKNWRARVHCKDEETCFADEEYFVACLACCPTLTITPTIGECQDDETLPITFDVVGTIPDPNCGQYVLSLNFGDGNFSASHPIDASSSTSFSFSETHSYPGGSYTVSVQDWLHLDCPITSIELEVQDCEPEDRDCCPTVQKVDLEIGDCDDDCHREVTLTTVFDQFVAPCFPATLEWTITDHSGDEVDNSNAFVTVGTAPDVYSTTLSASGSPYTATLNVIYPTRCTPQSIQINIAECDVPAKCPENLTITHSVEGCERPDPTQECKRRVRFVITADLFTGCGPSQEGTLFKLDFGDGAPPIPLGSASSGPAQFIVDHLYEADASGLTTATITVLEPNGCSESASTLINLPSCIGEPGCKECPPTPPRHCILCKLCHYVIELGHAPKRCKGLWLFLLGPIIAFTLISYLYQWITFDITLPWYQLLGVVATTIGTIVGLIWYHDRCGPCCSMCLILFGIILFLLTVLILLLIAFFSCLPVWVTGGFIPGFIPFWQCFIIHPLTPPLGGIIQAIIVLIVLLAFYRRFQNDCREFIEENVQPTLDECDL